MNKSYLLIDEPPLQVLPSLAVAIGFEEAAVLQQVHYWLSNPKCEGRVDEEGNKWIYNTYQEWQDDNFPFWSVQQIQRLFLKLEELELIISAKLDAKKHDQTKFYRIDYDKLRLMEHIKIDSSKGSKSNDVKMNQRIPENTTKQEYSILGIEAAMMQGRPVTQADLDSVNRINLAQIEFEAQLGCKPKWSNPDWEKVVKKLADLLGTDPNALKDFSAWRKDKDGGKFQGLTNAKMAQDATFFFNVAWPTYLADTAMKQGKKHESNDPRDGRWL